MKIILIAAIGKNNELGRDNKLIWHIKEDMDYFKKVTSNHNILMGKNTFLSLPKKLPNRHHIIISSSLEEQNDLEIFRSVDEFLDKYSKLDEEVYVIGGAMIYKEFLPMADVMHLTEIDETFLADAFFPSFNHEEYDREVLSSYDTPYKYKHVLYKKMS